MDQITALMPLWAFWAAFGVTLAAGFVKGVVGFAMPLVMISGLGLFLTPHLAVAGIIVPMMVANILQAGRFGPRQALEVAREYWRYIVIVCLTIAVVAQFLVRLPGDVMFLVLGVPVVLASLIQLFGVRLHIPQRYRVRAEWGFGALAGVLGGLTGTWGPPTVLYLIALDTPKHRQILMQGVVYTLGSATLFVAHLRSGILTGETLWFSLVLVGPAVVGMWLGFKVQDRLDRKVFLKATLAVLMLAGLNLIRKGLMG